MQDDIIQRLVDPVSKKNETLQTLYLNLNREEEVESILRACTTLINLNGIEVNRKELLGQDENNQSMTEDNKNTEDQQTIAAK